MKNLPIFSALALLFWATSLTLHAQDCDAVKINFSLLDKIGDTSYVNQLNTLDRDEQYCQLDLLTEYYFNRYAYKKVIFFSSYVSKSSVPKDSTKILQHWFRLTNAYHELGIPDSSLHYGRQLLLQLDQDILANLNQIPRVLEIVAMNFAEKLQYDLAYEWLDLIGLHLKILGKEKSEAFAAMLYVKSAIISLHGEIESAHGLLDSIINIYKEIQSPKSTTLLRTYSLAIRYNIYLQNLTAITEHINAYNTLQSTQATRDTATHIGYLMNLGFYHLIIGNDEKEEALTREAVALAKDYRKVPILWSKVSMYKAANLMDVEDRLGAVELGKEILSRLEGDEFIEGSFKELSGTLLNFISMNLYNHRNRNESNSTFSEIWHYRSLYSKYLSENFFAGNLANSKFGLSNDELNSLDENLITFWKYLKIDHPIDSLEIAYNFFEEYKGFIFNFQKSQRQVHQRRQKDNLTFKLISHLTNNLALNEKEFEFTKSDEGQYYNLKKRLKLRTEYFSANAIIQQNFKLFLDEIEVGNILPFDKLQEQIELTNKSVINYYITDKHLFTLIFTPTQNKFTRQKVSRDTLFSNVKKWREYIENPNSNISKTYKEANDYLYNTLIKPYKQILTSDVVIVGHGGLFQLPLGSLYSGTPVNRYNYKEYNWLIKDYQFSYTPTITSYFYNSNKSNTVKLEALSIAPKFLNSKSTSLVRNNIGKLSYNVEEAETVASIVNGEVLTGNFSTKNNIYNSISESTIVHFATHTITSQNDENSTTKLVLSTGMKDSFELVELEEIFPLENEVKLVVLSACNTNFGESLPGEGYISLASEFFKEGASTVISNSWDASDYSMKNIFNNFYRHIKNENSISFSLRESKLEYLRNSPNEITHPFYWSGLTTIGNGDLYFTSSNKMFLFLGGTFLLLLLIIFILRSKS